MLRWLRVVWPPWSYLGGIVLLLLVVEVPYLILDWKLGRQFGVDQDRPSYAVILMLLAAYGSYRVSAFHPVLRPGYGAWLETTPWTYHKPLPLGPVRLGAQDVLLVGLVVAAGWPLYGPRIVNGAVAFLVVYELFLCLCLSLAGGAAGAYLVAFGLGLGVRFIREPYYYSLPVLLANYAVAYAGLQRSLARFPWPVNPNIQFKSGADAIALQQQKILGWPFASLAPKFLDEHHIPLRHALLTSLLLGWWAYVAGTVPREEEGRNTILGCLFLATVLVTPFARWGIYGNGYQSPLGLWGRLLTGRWIIKGYDQVAVAPLLAFWCGSMIPFTLLLLGVPSVYAVPPGIAASLAITLGVGPDLRTWRLTGTHRLEIPAGQKAASVQTG